ncbi:hypothetical protein EDD15DRAFT_2401367 [Pisolithus albus]|nr:hypothetical protein EDD15DRAFT_2401367 [Pisolithus albus]
MQEDIHRWSLQTCGTATSFTAWHAVTDIEMVTSTNPNLSGLGLYGHSIPSWKGIVVGPSWFLPGEPNTCGESHSSDPGTDYVDIGNDAYEAIGDDGIGEGPPELRLDPATGGREMCNVDADKLSPENEGMATGDERINTGIANPVDIDAGGNGNSGVTGRGNVSHSGDDKLDNDLNSSEGGGDIELQEDGLGNDLTPSEGGGDTITGVVGGTGYRRDREAILLSGSVMGRTMGGTVDGSIVVIEQGIIGTSVLALLLLMISVPGTVGDGADPISLTIGEKGLPAYRAGLDRGVSGNRGPNGESSSRSMVMRSWHDHGTGDGFEGLLMEGIVTRRGECLYAVWCFISKPTHRLSELSGSGQARTGPRVSQESQQGT